MERASKHDLYSQNELVGQIRGRIVEGQEHARQRNKPTMASLMQAIQTNYDEFSSHFDLNQPRSWGEILPVSVSITAALQYAHLKTGGDLAKLYTIDDPSEWQAFIKNIVTDPVSLQLFRENMWRSPMVVSPNRALPLQYILAKYFKDDPITGIDLGAGLHVGTPLLNSTEFAQTEFPGKQSIPEFKGLNINTILGVDKQPRDIDWALASNWPIPSNLPDIQELKDLYQRASSHEGTFPFLQADVFDTFKISRKLKESSGESSADFLLTSFIRQQLGDNPLIQERFKLHMLELLKKNGIWVDIGAELLQRDLSNFSRYEVRVWRKSNNNTFEFEGVPFVFIDSQSKIGQTNAEFFIDYSHRQLTN
jgi:hypothetical protein